MVFITVFLHHILTTCHFSNSQLLSCTQNIVAPLPRSAHTPVQVQRHEMLRQLLRLDVYFQDFQVNFSEPRGRYEQEKHSAQPLILLGPRQTKDGPSDQLYPLLDTSSALGLLTTTTHYSELFDGSQYPLSATLRNIYFYCAYLLLKQNACLSLPERQGRLLLLLCYAGSQCNQRYL